MGLVTRASTSWAESPGACTNTSAIGTMICGSSSLGVTTTANIPRIIDASIISGVSFDCINALAILPDIPKFIVFILFYCHCEE